MFKFIDVKYKDIVDIKKLNIDSGKTTTIIGASGSGKTTVLRMLNKMISPTQGTILFNDVDLKKINSLYHRRQVTMLSQTPAMFEGNIRDNLNIALKFQERELPDDEILYSILEQLKLKKPLDSSVAVLSGGEKQRLALGRMLLLDPQVFLLDEPSSALDNETEEMIIKMLNQRVNKDKTIIMVTHSKAIAEKYSDTIIEMSHGRCKGEEY